MVRASVTGVLLGRSGRRGCRVAVRRRSSPTGRAIRSVALQGGTEPLVLGLVDLAVGEPRSAARPWPGRVAACRGSSHGAWSRATTTTARRSRRTPRSSRRSGAARRSRCSARGHPPCASLVRLAQRTAPRSGDHRPAWVVPDGTVACPRPPRTLLDEGDLALTSTTATLSLRQRHRRPMSDTTASRSVLERATVREIVMGAQDNLTTVLAVTPGVSIGFGRADLVALAGLSAAVAEAVSMGGRPVQLDESRGHPGGTPAGLGVGPPRRPRLATGPVRLRDVRRRRSSVVLSASARAVRRLPVAGCGVRVRRRIGRRDRSSRVRDRAGQRVLVVARRDPDSLIVAGMAAVASAAVGAALHDRIARFRTPGRVPRPLRAAGDQGTTTARRARPPHRARRDDRAVRRIAPKTRSVRKLFCDSCIQIPRPCVAPTYSAEDGPDDGVDHADPEAGEEIRQRRRPAQLPERLPRGRPDRAHQVRRLTLDPAEPVEEHDRDREERHEDDDRDLGQQAEPEPDDEERRDRHDRDRLAGDQQRLDGPSDRRPAVERDRRRDRERDRHDDPDERLDERGERGVRPRSPGSPTAPPRCATARAA